MRTLQLPIHEMISKRFRKVCPKKKTRRRSGPYTQGEWNKLCDSATHPWFRVNGVIARTMDTIVHFAIEKDPPKSLKKFFRYNSKEIAEEILRLLSQREE